MKAMGMNIKKILMKLLFSALLMSAFVQVGFLNPARSFFDNFIASIIIGIVSIVLSEIFGR